MAVRIVGCEGDCLFPLFTPINPYGQYQAGLIASNTNIISAAMRHCSMMSSGMIPHFYDTACTTIPLVGIFCCKEVSSIRALVSRFHICFLRPHQCGFFGFIAFSPHCFAVSITFEKRDDRRLCAGSRASWAEGGVRGAGDDPAGRRPEMLRWRAVSTLTSWGQYLFTRTVINCAPVTEASG